MAPDDDDIEVEFEPEGEYLPQPVALNDGELNIPDVALLDEALERFGVTALAYRNNGGDVDVLMVSEAGFKWSSLSSFTRRHLQAVQ